MVVTSPVRSVLGTVADPRVLTSSLTLLRRLSARPPMAAVRTNIAAKAARSLPRTERFMALGSDRPAGGASPDGGRCAQAERERPAQRPFLAPARSAARNETHLRRHLERLGRRRVGRPQAGAARAALQRPAGQLDLVQRLGGHLQPFLAHLGDAQARVSGLFEE